MTDHPPGLNPRNAAKSREIGTLKRQVIAKDKKIARLEGMVRHRDREIERLRALIEGSLQ